MPIDLRRAIATSGRAPRRLAASRLEQALVSPLHSWAIRAVYLARLEAAGHWTPAKVECWIVRS